MHEGETSFKEGAFLEKKEGEGVNHCMQARQKPKTEVYQFKGIAQTMKPTAD